MIRKALVAIIATLWSGFAIAAFNTAPAPYPTHAALLSAVATYVGPNISQSEFYSGTGGGATYVWNSNSYCPGGTSGTPIATDDIICIFPGHAAPYTSSVAGRYLLQFGTQINVLQLGFVPGGQDNSSLVPTLMNAMGPTTTVSTGGYDVNFPPVVGQQWTTYYFSKPFVMSRGAHYYCGGGNPSAYGNITLDFAAGVNGLVVEDDHYTADGGSGGGTIEGCRIASQGFALGLGTEGSNSITGVGFFNGDFNLNVPLSTWAIGDGIVVMANSGAYYPASVIPAVPPGTTVTNVSGTTLTISNNVASQFGSASAVFTETPATANNFVAGDSLTIGNNTYRFVSVIGAVAGNVLVGSNFINSATNLANCININITSATCVQQSTPPNVTADTPYGIAIGYWASTGGTAGNSLTSTYTPAGTSAGSFAGATFSGGLGPNNIRAYQLPLSQAFTVNTNSGSGVTLVTAGPRFMVPGDVIWSADFPLGTTVSTTDVTSVFTETSTNNFVAGDTVQAGNNTYTFVSSLGSTPGTVLVGPILPPLRPISPPASIARRVLALHMSPPLSRQTLLRRLARGLVQPPPSILSASRRWG